ncbi:MULTISPECIES: YifB family Mg chelatase-like AAA ATPase [Pontibacillus]|uniref:YifB family Mg chelatase-like AAA ATPase n=1 Tax=Pontibacillus chungwhensis TaxID=265426 RepID=A0ABY8UZG6_9BACI|nr:MULTISPECIES: YifB family Mg chelatase-like AAA ATPase [Pontibacillus]MCD5324147.1 YifB family Mg chelatase-like AAA ATPase [Pontibacillus sp. HN14]WIF97795.1 YifB family Mg chelatase-like AAA ATPase [Pontibacillus chungwhensis]
MAVAIQSIGLKGIEGYPVTVEVEKLDGVESVVVAGLPGAAVKESKERVLAALKGFGINFTDRRVIVNLSPAEEKKHGPMFDVAMAIGILKCFGSLKGVIPDDTAFIGSLSLTGKVQSIRGILPAIMSAKKLGIKRLFIPYDCSVPIQEIEGLEIIYVEYLMELVDHLSGGGDLSLVPPMTELALDNGSFPGVDFKEVIGQEKAKRALEVAAAGGHNVMMIGPPGCGKSLLAESFPSIMPKLELESQLENISLYELANTSLSSLGRPPFRSPHHSASAVSIIGGGSNPTPGEISLANHGVLFLDELAEFPKKTLDMLRQPLESGRVTISRAQATVTYPAKFLLLSAMNPCPCGYLGATTHYCTCSPKQVQAYQNKVSGPVQDRIDIILHLTPVNLQQQRKEDATSSSDIQKRVQVARDLQYKRHGKVCCNADLSIEEVRTMIPLTEEQKSFLQNRAVKENWSNRVQMKMHRLARTISDLRGEEAVSDEALWEAVTMRRGNSGLVKKKVVK